MYHTLRNSGIKTIGNVKWGTHIGQIYSSPDDFFEIGVPYIQSGLANNELCAWIYSQNTSYEEVKFKLGEFISDVDSYLESGQLRIFPHTDWYLKDNSFNEVRLNRQWSDLISDSKKQGFDGLRAIADTYWLEKSYFRDFANYECNIHKVISNLPFIVICLYDANKLDAFETAQIIKNHSFVITKYEQEIEIIENIELLIRDKQLEESEARYEKLIQLLPDAVFIHDENRIYYCNESALQITGFKNRDKLFDSSMMELMSPETRHSFKRFINKSLSGSDKPNYFVTKFLCLNKEIKTVEIVSMKYLYDGNPAILSVVRDTTPFAKIKELKKDMRNNKKLLSAAREYEKVKSEFFSNISHELRTPLNIILATLQLIDLKKDHGITNVKVLLKIINQNCYRLVRLVNNLIDITKIDSNYFEINRQNHDIIALVKKIAMSVSEYANIKDIKINFYSNSKSKIIACDPDQIERIILNLISNAIKFTPRGGYISASVLDYGEKIDIIIKDNGIGIPQDKHEHVFDRFQKVENSLTQQAEGSGIGLSLVKALVEKHDGRITLSSDLGKGSEFKIELPAIILNRHDNNPNDKIQINKNCTKRINIEFSDIYL